MSYDIFIQMCSKEYKICSEESEPKSKLGKCMSQNQDIIFIAIAAIFATFSVLVAYNYIPMLCTTAHPMFIAGCLATGAGFAFIWGLMRLATRCIDARKSSTAP